MDLINKAPGLRHISENIFKLLNGEDLKTCRLVNQSMKEIIDTPKFWIQKLSDLPVQLLPIAQSEFCTNVHCEAYGQAPLGGILKPCGPLGGRGG